MESSHGEMKAWTRCPHLQEQGKKKPRAALCHKNKGVVGKAPKNVLLCTHLYPNPLHTCHSHASSLLPAHETLEGDSSSVNSAHLQKLGGSLWHISGMGGWMDSGGTAQDSLAGICWPILCCPSLQHFWAFLCALGSHPRKEHKSHWRIPCRSCMLPNMVQVF